MPKKSNYSILGISSGATNEEVRDAYRKMAKEYHPDHYINTPFAKMAEEKMAEVNAAYEAICNQRKLNNPEEESEPEQSDSPKLSSENELNFADIRYYLNSDNPRKAKKLLLKVPDSQRNDEWFFLSGCLLFQEGLESQAKKMIQKAIDMNPEPEYRDALKEIQ